jgi:hypothetical protein
MGFLKHRYNLILVLDRKALMGWVCLSVFHSSTAALGKPYVYGRGNKGNQPERKLAAISEPGS